MTDIHTGELLEERGWLQARLIPNQFLAQLVELSSGILNVDQAELIANKQAVLLVASQSCDIANRGHPIVELSIATPTKRNNSFLHNLNPRRIHLPIHRVNEEDITEEYFEIHISQKLFVSKEFLLEVDYCKSSTLDEQSKRDYTHWLAAQYNRPALPTTFNNRLREADPRQKLRKAAKKLHPSVSGIYIEISPYAEVDDDSTYNVNLLIAVDSKALLGDADLIQASNNMQDIFANAGFDVKMSVRAEQQISISLIKRFKRFNFDDLSFRDDSATLPPDIALS